MTQFVKQQMEVTKTSLKNVFKMFLATQWYDYTCRICTNVKNCSYLSVFMAQKPKMATFCRFSRFLLIFAISICMQCSKVLKSTFSFVFMMYFWFICTFMVIYMTRYFSIGQNLCNTLSIFYVVITDQSDSSNYRKYWKINISLNIWDIEMFFFFKFLVLTSPN